MSDRKRDPILILGNGGFGTATALALRWGGNEVRVWGYHPGEINDIVRDGENKKFLPGIPIPSAIQFSSTIEDLTAGVRTVLSVVPTQFLRQTLLTIKSALPSDASFVSCSKGFERSSLALPSQMIRDIFPRARVAVLSGPSHAEEVGLRLPTTVVVAAETLDDARSIQSRISTQTLRVYTSPDPLGVEIAGASKNVIALAAGISDGLGFGDNARAALVCRGAIEMTRLGEALGAHAETFMGLSGIGDLVATCTSRHSRNRSVGLRIGRGETLKEILDSTEKVAEGVETTRGVHALAQKLDVDLPITAEVHAVLFETKSPRDAVVSLMTRQPKGETI